MHRSTFLPLQHAATLISSVDWGQVVNEIIKGKKAITPDTAIGLAKVLGIEAQFWTNLEANYQMTLARERDRKARAADSPTAAG